MVWIVVTVEDLKDKEAWKKYCKKHKLDPKKYKDDDKVELTVKEEKEIFGAGLNVK